MKYIWNFNKKFWTKIFVFVVFFFLVTFVFGGITTKASTSINSYDLEISIDEEFTDDIILVTLTAEESLKFNSYTIEDFPEIHLESVVELTDELVEDMKESYDINSLNSENSNIINDNQGFLRRILKLKLLNPSKENVLSAINILNERTDIHLAEPNYIGEFFSITTSDTAIGDQWAINNLGLNYAWKFTQGIKNIKVGVVDSGIDKTHPDLKNQINESLSKDFTGSDNPWTDGNVHGTHVAGIIGATGNNGMGISGVNWNVELVSLKVGNNTPTSENVANAILHAQKYDIDVINLSLGIRETSAVNDAISKYEGIIVCAAGNSGVEKINYPASSNSENIISVGSIDSNNKRSSFSNWGNVDIWAPGENILSTIPLGSTPSGYTRHSDGYAYTDGTSMAAPYVTGAVALLLSLKENFTISEIKDFILDSAEIINITHPSGILGLSTTTISVKKLNIYNIIKNTLPNIKDSQNSLTNYTGMENIKNIKSQKDNVFSESNAFYQLNINYQKNFEIKINSDKAIQVTIYDEYFNELPYNDLNINEDEVYIIKNFSIRTYYLRVSYMSDSSTGTINTEIISRNTAYLTEGENDILINTYNNDDEYNFINHNGPSFYKFSIEATKADGSVVTYPYASLKIYDHMNSSQEDKYNIDGYSELAQSIDNNNYLYMYLERNGYYYIHVNMPDASYTSVKLNIERVSVDEIEVASRFNEAFTETLINSNDMTEYATGFSIDQTSVFTIDVTTSQTYTGNITFILFRKAYNNDTKEYYIDEVVGDYIPLESDELRKILVEGTYYIGFFGNTSNVPVTIKINRIVTTSEITDQVLVMDLDENLPYGTEVRHNDGEYGGKTITEGFTRHIHFQNVTGVPSVSRYDYSFYSSNKNYATVSEFGTVFAKSVTGNKTVTITAVYKYDPAIIFTIELTIIDDTSNTEKVIETTQTISLSEFENGKYKLVLDENNSPYPWIQYYNWSVFVPCQADDIAVTIDNYGFLTTSGVGSATLTGTYSINPNVTLIIQINFVE